MCVVCAHGRDKESIIWQHGPQLISNKGPNIDQMDNYCFIFFVIWSIAYLV